MAGWMLFLGFTFGVASAVVVGVTHLWRLGIELVGGRPDEN